MAVLTLTNHGWGVGSWVQRDCCLICNSMDDDFTGSVLHAVVKAGPILVTKRNLIIQGPV